MSYLLHGLVAQARQDAVRAGIIALIESYYDEYTDAEKLENGFIGALTELLTYLPDALNAEDELAGLVCEAEDGLNEHFGGIRGSDGRLHKVCTFPDRDDD